MATSHWQLAEQSARTWALRSKKTAMKYWHVTSMKNVKAIRKCGLLPQIGKNSEICSESIPRVYMFVSREEMENALSHWLWLLFDYDEEIAILRITITDELKPFCSASEGFECEVACTERIPPEYIEFFDEEYNALALDEGE